ncbi:hypothetical protein EC988_002615 [Linderina pennispora]|nr:hypothetical protein EC988_002615 [Linderina pennispora]
MTKKSKERQGMGEKRKRSKEKSTEKGKTTRVKKVKIKKEAATSSAPDGYMKPEPAYSTDPVASVEPEPEPDLETESEYEEEGTSSGSESVPDPEPEVEPEPGFASQEEEDAPDSEPESITTPFESPPLVARINSELPQTELLISGEGRCNRSKRALSMLEGVSLEELRYIWQELCDGKDRMTINEKYGCFDVKGAAIKPGGVMQLRINGKRLVMHILVYLLWYRRLYVDMPVYHLCNKNCCANPTHLIQEPVDYNRTRKKCRESSFTKCPHLPKCLIFAEI